MKLNPNNKNYLFWFLVVSCLTACGQNHSSTLMVLKSPPSKKDKKNDSISVQLMVGNKGKVDGYSNQNHLFLDIYLSSLCKQKIKVNNEKDLLMGVLDFSFADGIFEVITTSTNGLLDSTLKVMNDCDPIVPLKQKLKTISKSQSVKYKGYDLACYYQFTPGRTYFICVRYKLSKYNHLNDIYSDWIIVTF